jgi:hypothetical protein
MAELTRRELLKAGASRQPWSTLRRSGTGIGIGYATLPGNFIRTADENECNSREVRTLPSIMIFVA